jgi:hypothetical protein
MLTGWRIPTDFGFAMELSTGGLMQAATSAGGVAGGTVRRSKRFHVFLCYNRIDAEAVLGIGEELKRRGLSPWIDTEQLRPGICWQRELERTVSRIESVAVLVGKNGRGPWQDLEIRAFLREFVRRDCPVIPVILRDAGKRPKLPVFLRDMIWVDFRRGEPDPLEQLIWGITGSRQDEQ